MKTTRQQSAQSKIDNITWLTAQSVYMADSGLVKNAVAALQTLSAADVAAIRLLVEIKIGDNAKA